LYAMLSAEPRTSGVEARTREIKALKLVRRVVGLVGVVLRLVRGC